MLHKIKSLFIFFCFVINSLAVFSQVNGFRYEGKKELVTDIVYKTIKDSRNRIWLASTSGLYLNFGGGFLKLGNKEHDNNSILPGDVFVVTEDNEDRLWIGSYKNGITIYNPNDNSYNRLTNKTHKEIFSESNILNIEIANDDSIRIYTTQAMFLMNSNNYKYQKKINSEILMSTKWNNGILYLTEKDGLLFYDSIGNKIIIPQEEGKIAMRMDKIRDKIFVTSSNGIYQIKDFKLFKMKVFFENKNISDDMFNGISQDSDENIIINCFRLGPILVNRLDKKFIRCVNLSTKKWYGSGNSIYSSYYDKDLEFFYIGSTLGLYKVKRKTKVWDEVISKEIGSIKSIFYWKNELFLGGESGLFVAGKTRKPFELRNNSVNNPGYTRAYYCYSNRLFATGNGIFEIKDFATNITSFNKDEHLADSIGQNVLSATIQDSTLVFGTQNGRYFVLDAGGQIIYHNKVNITETIYPPLIARTNFEYIYHSYTGIYQMNIKSGQNRKIPLSKDLRVNDMIYSANKVYLATNTNGIWILDSEYNELDKINLVGATGLNKSNSLIVKDSLIWFANSTGIGFVNMNNKKITFLESGDAFETSNFAYASKYDGGDSIYFGGENGVVIINTKKIQELKQDFNTFIMLPSVYRDGKKYSLTSDQEKDLTYNQNNLEYQIVHTNYKYPSMVRFQYRLNESLPWIQADKSGLLKLYNLPPDKYNIQVKDQNTDKIVASRTFTINPPWYQTWWFRILLLAAILINVFYMTRLYYRRRIIAQQKEIEKQKSIRRERERISRDLHDDIGSGLSAVKLQAEYLESLPKDEWTKENLHNIVDESEELTTSMREIVWSLNTQYDNLKDFVQYTRRYAVQYFDKSKIKLNIEAPMDVQDIELNGLVRRNVFLVYKEALHNIIKHSQASEVNVQIEVSDAQLMISIQDNGSGFNAEGKSGNGLQSMQYRMNAVSGKYDLKSSTDGTTITFSIHL